MRLWGGRNIAATSPPPWTQDCSPLCHNRAWSNGDLRRKNAAGKFCGPLLDLELLLLQGELLMETVDLGTLRSRDPGSNEEAVRVVNRAMFARWPEAH